MALGFKSQKIVLLNLPITAPCEAAFANLKMLLLAKLSEDRFDETGPSYEEDT